MSTLLADSQGWTRRGTKGPAVVAFGGGHGLSATLRALRHVTRRITAVVTVADDGGSSGRLRKELGVLPPGDLRMALAALCDDSQWGLTWRDAMQHRFSSQGELNYHALGNLLIVTMWDMLHDTVEGLDWVAKLLGCHGRVLPMASIPVDMYASINLGDNVTIVKGQSHIARSRGKIEKVWIEPPSPPAPHQVLDAIDEADFVVLGPGSWYTSVIPHLLSQEIHQALIHTPAKRILIANLASQKGETEGLSVTDHLQAFYQHAPHLRIDTVIVDPSTVDSYDAVDRSVKKLGGKILLRDVIDTAHRPIHDSLRLAAALRDTFEGYSEAHTDLLP